MTPVLAFAVTIDPALTVAILVGLVLLMMPQNMLVLSRHCGESIIIGDDIVITVVDIRGDKVRLGIAAPIEISVHRQEVYEAIQRENRQASRLDPQDARQLEHLDPPARRDIRRPRTENDLPGSKPPNSEDIQNPPNCSPGELPVRDDDWGQYYSGA